MDSLDHFGRRQARRSRPRRAQGAPWSGPPAASFMSSATARRLLSPFRATTTSISPIIRTSRAARHRGDHPPTALGAGSSRLVTGNHPLHAELEARLARLKGTEGACVFGSGFLANAGIIPALIGQDDLVILDELSHACPVGPAPGSPAPRRAALPPQRCRPRRGRCCGAHRGRAPACAGREPTASSRWTVTWRRWAELGRDGRAATMPGCCPMMRTASAWSAAGAARASRDPRPAGRAAADGNACRRRSAPMAAICAPRHR